MGTAARSVVDLFEARVVSAPDAVALVLDDLHVTYATLHRWSDRLAAHLQRSHGVRAETLVGVHLGNGIDQAVALLAILKAGGAFVPLGLDQPAARLAQMLRGTGVRLVLARSPLPAEIGRYDGTWVHLEGDPDELPDEAPRPAARWPGRLAYVIHTSGSTGPPKGVMIEHRGLANLVAAQGPAFGIGPGSRVLQFATLSFDAAVAEIFVTLTHGGALHFVGPEERLPGPHLAELLRRHRITVVTLPSSTLAVTPDHGLDDLATVVCAGEICWPGLVTAWARRRRFFNAYGPTEASVCATVHECGADERDPVPVGRPLPNVEVDVLDGRLAPVGPGAVGELCLAGAGLARGYAGQPGPTADRFRPDPHATVPGARLYRTGDRARQHADGAFEVLGRLDRQVKIRGFRIEPEEVEAAMQRHPGVLAAAVTVDRGTGMGARLVAYFVPRPAADLRAAAIREWLKTSLPAHMLPGAFVRLERLPTGPSGKVDLGALPAAGTADDGDAEYVPPRTPLERLLVAMCEQVLELERLGVYDDFMQRGSTSIRIALLLARLQEVFDPRIYISALLDNLSVAELARYLRAEFPGPVAAACGEEHLPPANVDPDHSPAVSVEQVREFRQLVGARRPARHRPPVRARRAVFVLSPPRSGSTLLRVMLAGHDRLFAPPELEMLSFATLGERHRALSGRFAFWKEGAVRAVMEARACGADEALGLMTRYEAQDLPTLEFFRLLQGWIGDRVLVDKTPAYALHEDTLRFAEAGFDGPLYVHLCRHPLGMVSSFVEARNDQVFFRYPHSYALPVLGELIWTVCHQNILAFLADVEPDRRLLLRYEDLTAAPEAAMRSVCELTGLPFTAAMLDPYADQERKMTDGIHPLSQMIGDVKFHSYSCIDPAAAGRWRERYAGVTLGPEAEAIARRLGYAVETSAGAGVGAVPGD